MNDRFSFQFAAAVSSGVFNQHDGDQIARWIDSQLHHVTLDLVALPDLGSGQNIDRLKPRSITEIACKQDQIGSRYWRHCRLIYPAGFSPPDPFACLTVD